MNAATKAKLYLLSTLYCPFPRQSSLHTTNTQLGKARALLKVFSRFWVLVAQQCPSEVVPSQPWSRQTSNNIAPSQVLPRLTSVALMPLPSHTSRPTAVWPGCGHWEEKRRPCHVSLPSQASLVLDALSPAPLYVFQPSASVPGDLACRSLWAPCTLGVH